MLRRIKGQSTLEYAMIIAVVVGALLIMQNYMKRGVQGKLRESTDSIGQQYSAGNIESKFTTEQKGDKKTKETFGLDPDDPKELKQGVSYKEVISPAEKIIRKAEDTDAETITKKLNEEPLFP